MHARLKSFLLWILIALLPLQGVAAVVRASCSTNDQHPTAHGQMVARHGHVPKASDYVAMQHGESVGHVDHLNFPDPTGHSHQHSSGFCHTCGDCCLGSLALPFQVSWALPAPGRSAEVPGAVTLHAGFIPDSLERPPRHTSV